jgi:hypothetical protein
MSSQYINFAKAYIRYDQQLKTTTSCRLTMTALRLLEASLIELEGQADITKVSQRHLDNVVTIIQKEGYKNLNGISSSLKQIAQNLAEWHIALSNIKYWKHPFVKSNSCYLQSKTKLPDDDALLALAEIFANGYKSVQDDEDIFITCTSALLLSAPMRLGETLYFRTNPLRKEKDSNGKEQLKIAYWVPKNGKYVHKEIPEIMADHAQEAVRRIVKITEESRKLARHFEDNPNQFYRHDNCPNVPDDQVLTWNQITLALGLKSINAISCYFYRHTGSYTIKGWTLNSIWKLVLADHHRKNPHFPYQVNPSLSTSGKPLKMSESLMCFRNNQLATNYNTSPVLLAPMRKEFFSMRVNNSDPRMNIFVKHGYGELKLHSHQFRHFLNTMAEEAGVGIDAITEWSTRAKKQQSCTYMHQDDTRKAQKISDRLGLSSSQSMAPVTEEEYQVMKHGPIITTRYGICNHDYTLSLCNKFADCLNCSELLLCKGDKKSIKAIQKERDHVAENLAATQIDIDSGIRVASRWHDGHSKTLTRHNKLLEVMTDPKIPDGSIIQMQGNDFTHESRILDNSDKTDQLEPNNEPLSLNYSKDIAECFKILQEETNG